MNKKGSQIFWGIFLLVAAALLVAGQLGMLGEVNWFTIILTVLLAGIIIKSIYPVNFAGILFPLAFLAIIYDEQLGIEVLTPWTVLIVALIGSIGLSLIFSKRHHSYSHKESGIHNEEVIDNEDEDFIYHKTTFGSTSKYINSDNFKGAEFECSFGAMGIYFKNAKIQGDFAEVTLNVNCGALEMYVPKEWRVDSRLVNSLAAIDYKNECLPTADKTLVLKGKISLCGIEIIYV